MLPNIFHFTPLNGLTRLETMEREMILFALVKSRAAPYNRRRGKPNVAAAARWLGVSRNTLYLRLRLLENLGHSITLEQSAPRSPCPSHRPSLVTHLKAIGMKPNPTRKNRFWNQSREALQDIFDAANRIRLAKVRELRPDLNPSDEGMSAIHHWLAIRRIFERRGFSLSRLRS